jgi:outer membrane protein assembly factor BamA
MAVAAAKISGTLPIPISEQDTIINSTKLQVHGDSVGEVTDEAFERVRAGWQNRGYFKVQVKTLTRSHGWPIALEVRVDEGMQYRLREITFKNNKVIGDGAGLRDLFPIEGGDIFSREKIAMGLESLRKAYGELAYINFTAVPDTLFDDTRGTTSLEIDVDAGKQFHVSGVNIVGLDENSRQEILKDFPVGHVYNEKVFRKSVIFCRSK